MNTRSGGERNNEDVIAPADEPAVGESQSVPLSAQMTIGTITITLPNSKEYSNVTLRITDDGAWLVLPDAAPTPLTHADALQLLKKAMPGTFQND